MIQEPDMNKPPKRPLTPAYIIFYILFWPDTWRILVGLLLALMFTPLILPADMAAAGRAMLYVMVTAIQLFHQWAGNGANLILFKIAFWIITAVNELPSIGQRIVTV